MWTGNTGMKFFAGREALEFRFLYIKAKHLQILN